MKLTDLHPEHGALDYATGHFFLMFDCPTTPGGRVYVQFHRDAPRPGVWQCTSEYRVVPSLEHLGPLPDISILTLAPSIGPHHCTRHALCPGHVSIKDGMVVP